MLRGSGGSGGGRQRSLKELDNDGEPNETVADAAVEQAMGNMTTRRAMALQSQVHPKNCNPQPTTHNPLPITQNPSPITNNLNPKPITLNRIPLTLETLNP